MAAPRLKPCTGIDGAERRAKEKSEWKNSFEWNGKVNKRRINE